MIGSKTLVKSLCKFRGIDADLFQSEEEWELADTMLLARLDEKDVQRLEGIAARIPTASQKGSGLDGR